MYANDLELRSVSKLLTESFFIPAYQRGYRWNARQVTELLDDVFTFMKEQRRARGEFYCLQPVVLARREKEQDWELIDGQQRLTTIFLVLSYFNNRFTEEERTEFFSLEYKTREKSAAYLRTLDDEGSRKNIDFFHIWRAYQAIREWFKDKKSFINDMESAFLNDVKIIWYEVHGDVNPIAVFTRLNMGKIPLTNAELVKALFLKGSNFEKEGTRARYLQQLKIAQEWDQFERRLQDDAFWFFLANVRQEANRIDFVLGLRAGELPSDPILRRDTNYLFLMFNGQLSKSVGGVTGEWDKIKRLFLLLDEWFSDRYLYHVIGFLLTLNVNVSRIRDLAQGASSKTAFRQALKGEIFREVFKQAPGEKAFAEMRQFIAGELAALDYEDNPKVIRHLLLLFNIVSLLEIGDAGPRFPFEHFKKDHWDLEHIRSVKSGMPLRKDDQKAWLGHVLEYLSESETVGADAHASEYDAYMAERLRTLRESDPFDSVAFSEVFNDVVDRYDPGSDLEADNSIGNLALLDAGTNRGYGNAIFPHKRRKLIALDKAGKFVPLCTKNAFLKYYSPRIDKMLIWNRQDAAAHQAAIVDSLTRFFAFGSEQV